MFEGWPECFVEGAFSNGCCWLPPKFVEIADLGGRLALLGPWESVCLRTASLEWNVPGKYGPYGELFFCLIQKEPATMPDGETLAPSSMLTSALLLFSADVLKKCAYRLALHCGRRERRRRWIWGETGCPKSPMWESEGEAWSEDESVSSGSREDTVCKDALHVIGLYGPGVKISIFLQDWVLAKVALSCHMALDMLCQEMQEAW